MSVGVAWAVSVSVTVPVLLTMMALVGEAGALMPPDESQDDVALRLKLCPPQAVRPFLSRMALTA